MLTDIVRELIDIAEQDPLSLEDTSSHWRLYGPQSIIEQRGDNSYLRGQGFGGVHAPGRIHHTLNTIERFAYWRITRQIKSYRSIFKAATQLARHLSFDMTFDVWKQSVVLAILKDHWIEYNLEPKTFALIGDGYGFLGALIRCLIPDAYIYNIDLPKTLVFQAVTHSSVFPTRAMSVMSTASGHADTTFVLPKDIELIPNQIDCGINVASMQEMTESSIELYFRFLRVRSKSSSRFYCVNRKRKELPGGEVLNFTDYPWSLEDDIFLDGVCPYYRFFLGRTQPNGPSIFGIRVPLINHFDGLIMHRLCHLESN